jgi:hypothetical protein
MLCLASEIDAFSQVVTHAAQPEIRSAYAFRIPQFRDAPVLQERSRADGA